MNDRRINDLVRMALEVEELEQSIAAPRLRIVGSAPARREGSAPRTTRNWFVGIGLAAAAGLALVFALPALTHRSQPDLPRTNIAGINPSNPGPTPGPQPIIVRNVTLPTSAPTPKPIDHPSVIAAMDRIDPGSVERCIVMAIYRDALGAMHCVQHEPQEWSGNKCLSEVSQQELRCVTVGKPCTPGANRALLVAMAGPERSLPRTDADAFKVATCILGSPCENDSKCFAHAAAECVPSDVAVKIESTTEPR